MGTDINFFVERRENGRWLSCDDEMLRDVSAPEVNVSEITRKSAEFGERNARTLEEFAHKITLLRQGIAKIAEDSRGCFVSKIGAAKRLYNGPLLCRISGIYDLMLRA